MGLKVACCLEVLIKFYIVLMKKRTVKLCKKHNYNETSFKIIACIVQLS